MIDQGHLNRQTDSTDSDSESHTHDPALKPRRRRWFKLFAVILAIFIGLLIGELILRVTGYVPRYAGGFKSFHVSDPKFGFRGKPDFTGRFSTVEFDVWVKHDGLGFRVHENKPMAESLNDFHVLGDSFTWGHGVNQGEVFTDLLQKEFSNHHVFNWGRSGTGTVIQYHIFNERIAPNLKEGDWVMVAFYQNDFDDCLNKRYFHVEIDENREIHEKISSVYSYPVRNFLKHNSRLFNLLFYLNDIRQIKRRNKKADNQTIRIDQGAADEKGDQKNIDDDGHAYVVHHYLNKIHEACRAKGARLVVAMVPSKENMLTDGHDSGIQTAYTALSGICVNSPWEYIDVMASFREIHQTSDRPLHFPYDRHFTPEGHRVFAGLIADELKVLLSGSKAGVGKADEGSNP